MAEARGLRNVNPKVGTFVLVTVAIAALGIYLAGRAQGWFEKTLSIRTLPVSVPADSTLGLTNGAEVQIFGSTVGTVTDVRVYEEKAGTDPGLRLEFVMQVRGPMLELVKKDSKVVIQRKFGVAGTAYVQLTPGRGAPATSNDRLPCQIARDLTKMVEETLDGLNRPDGPLQQSLANVKMLTGNLNTGKGTIGRLLNDDATAKSIEATLANVETLTANLKKGQGMAGKLLNDADTADQIAGAIKNLNETLASLNKIVSRAQAADLVGLIDQVSRTLSRVDTALVEVTATTADLRKQTHDLPSLILQTQEMMRQTTRAIEAAQKTWLLRDYVAQDGSTRLSPVDVQSK